MARLLGQDIGHEPMAFSPLHKNFHSGRHVNTSSTNIMLTLKKTFRDFSINVIEKPSATGGEIDLYPLKFIPSVWTKTKIPVLFKTLSK